MVARRLRAWCRLGSQCSTQKLKERGRVGKGQPEMSRESELDCQRIVRVRPCVIRYMLRLSKVQRGREENEEIKECTEVT